MTYKGTLPAFKKMKLPVLSDNGHWAFPEKMGEGVGFIYVIYDTVLQRAYLGKKRYRGMGKKNAGVESNWKKYTSSSPILGKLLEARPREEFLFVAIEEYPKVGVLAYAETWSLCKVEAPTTKNWYNTRIEKISWSVSTPITQRHKERLNRIVEMIDNGETEF